MTAVSEIANRLRLRLRRISAAVPSLRSDGDRREQQTAVKTDPRPQKRLRTIMLAVFAALLTWLVVSHSLVAYLANVSPKIALWLSPEDPEALVNLADQSLNANTPLFGTNAADQGTQGQEAGGSPSAVGSAGDATGQTPQADDNKSSSKVVAHSTTTDAGNLDATFALLGRNRSVDLATIGGEAESTLMGDPLNPRALRILGQAADAAGNDPDAVKFMQAAAQLSLHESVAVYWLMLKSTEAGDYKTAIAYADVLLRTNLGFGPYVAPLLAHFADNKASNGLVKALLYKNPPWRDIFFKSLPASVSDVRTPLDILLALKSKPAPPTSEEIGDYLTYLIAHKYYNLAYYAWLQLLSPEELKHVGLLYNGHFENAPSGLPFDWTITQGSGVAIDIVPQSDTNNERALSVDFLYGRVDYHSVSELVLLAPGTYQFEGKYKGELLGPRGLKWRVACANDPNAPIAESPMIGGVASTWKDTKFTFTVPDADCGAQYVRLDLDARMAS
jgi:hypothetical protein